MKRTEKEKEIAVTNTNELGELKYKPRYPTYENPSEFVQHAGDDKIATDFINGAVTEAIDRYVRTRLRTASKGTDKGVLTSELDNFCANWTPANETQQTSKAEMQGRLSALEAKLLSGTATQEEMLAIIRGKQAAA